MDGGMHREGIRPRRRGGKERESGKTGERENGKTGERESGRAGFGLLVREVGLDRS